MVWVRGGMFKLDIVDRALGFLVFRHFSVMERDTILFFFCVLDHQSGDTVRARVIREWVEDMGHFWLGSSG